MKITKYALYTLILLVSLFLGVIRWYRLAITLWLSISEVIFFVLGMVIILRLYGLECETQNVLKAMREEKFLEVEVVEVVPMNEPFEQIPRCIR